jgi:hypothetical protein
MAKVDDLSFNATVKDGKLIIHHRDLFVGSLPAFEGAKIEVILRRRRKRRSLAMNAYYWAEIIPKVQKGLRELGTKLTLKETDLWLVDFLRGISKEQAHTFLKERYLESDIVDEHTGEIIKHKKSTAVLNTEQFQDYIADVTQFATEHLCVFIAPPGQQSIEFDEQ